MAAIVNKVYWSAEKFYIFFISLLIFIFIFNFNLEPFLNFLKLQYNRKSYLLNGRFYTVYACSLQRSCIEKSAKDNN